MRKILTIAQREYSTRVLTKIFWVSVLLVPIGMLALVMIPYLAANSIEKEKATVFVVDDSSRVLPYLGTGKDTFISYEKSTLPSSEMQKLKKEDKLPVELKKGEVLLVFYPGTLDSPKVGVSMAYNGKLSLQLAETIDRDVKRAMNAYRLKKLGFQGNPLEFAVLTQQVSVDDSGKISEGTAAIAAFLGYGMAFLNYMMVFIYGMMVMRGVVEEKTSRIVEVILSSVKPFQLMAGKLLGICAVGLTQFLLWVSLSFVATYLAGSLMAPAVSDGGGAAAQAGGMGMNAGSIFFTVMGMLSPQLLFCFVFYFLGGFLLFGSLFAAIGSAVDQEQDTQQLMWPVTIPLIIPMLLIGNVLVNPNGSLAVFMSIFPISSPTIMMIRLSASEVPWYEVLLSMGLLVVGIIVSIWLAARIYRTGILLYGKKVTLKELGKWILKS